MPLTAAAVVLVWASPGSAPFRAAITSAVAVAGAVIATKPDVFRSLPLKSISLPLGIGFELRDMPQIEEETNETTLDQSAPLADRWLQVRWKIERKLAYIAKHTLPDHLPLVDPKAEAHGRTRPFVTLGSLVEDGWLSKDEARVLTYALALSPSDLTTVAKTEVDDLLAAAERVAHVMRARVFQQLVGRFIDGRDGWRVVDRSGLRSTVESGPVRFVVVPVFGTRNGPLVARQVERLRDAEIDHAIVVVPCYPGTSPRPPAQRPGPYVVRLDQLADLVAELASGD